MPGQVCVFDAYGTLFDVAAAARQAAEEPGAGAWASAWPGIAADWRRKQLEYSWLRSLAGAHADFWQVTQDALDWALGNAGLSGDAALRERLLALYWQLPAYPDAQGALEALKARGLRLAVLSNGSPAMLGAAIESAGLTALLEDALSAEEVGVFKPDARVYDMVGKRFGTAPRDVLFVSANGWDACSAASYGFRAVWLNRDNAPPDRLHGAPAHVLPDLSALPALVNNV